MCTITITGRGVQTSPALFEVTGSDGSGIADSSADQALHEANSNLSQCSVAETEHGFRSYDNDPAQVVTRSTMVGQYAESDYGSVMVDTNTQGYYDHRCVLGSLGSALQWEEGSGPLDLTTGQDAYKCTGAVGSMERVESFSPFPSPQRSPHSDGQHSGPVLYQQVRRYQVDSPMQQSMGHDDVVSEVWHTDSGNTYSGQGQCSGGQVVSSPGLTFGVGLETGSGRSNLSDLGITTDGFVCDSREHQTTQILFSGSPSQSIECGWTRDQIESEMLLRFSTGSNTGSIIDEGSSGRGDSDTHCTQVAQERVVSNSPGSPDRCSHQATISTRPGDTGSGNTLAPKSSRSGIGGLEDKRAGLLASGLSGAAAATCLAATSDSTRRSYAAGWRDFSA